MGVGTEVKIARRILTDVAVLGGLIPIIAASSVGPGTRAPSVQLQVSDGTIVQTADLLGKVVLLDFWASWCPPCKTSFPALDALYRREHVRGLEVLAINLDEQRKDAEAFLRTHPHMMPVAFDRQGKSPIAFAVKGMPSSVLIDRTGTIRFVHEGYSAKTLDRYREEIDLLLSEKRP